MVQGSPITQLVCHICAVPPHGKAVSVGCLRGIHELNGKFLSARSYQEAEQMVHEVLHASATIAGSQPHKHLIAVLSAVVSNCEPPSALALHCLIFLASSSPQAQELMAMYGVVPLLVGQLLGAADSLEPALRLGSLQLLKLLSISNPKRIINGSSLAAVLRVVVACLQDKEPAVCSLGLQIFEELAYSCKVLERQEIPSQILPMLESLSQANVHAGVAHKAARLRRLLLDLPRLMNLSSIHAAKEEERPPSLNSSSYEGQSGARG